MLISVYILLCFAAVRGSGEEIHGRVSESVILTCTTNAADCGEIHSIKWYRGMDRVYVYSPFTNFRNAEGILVDRSNVVDSESSSDLQVDQLQATDDGDYRCEITYLDVSTACPTVYNHKLITTALPEAVKLSVGEEELVSVQQPELGIETGVAGPFQLGEEVEFVCEAVQFKPEAEISWKLGEEQLDGASEQMEDLDDGTRSLKSSLKLSVDRQHLGVSVICSVSFEEENVADLSVELDLEVPPSGLVVMVEELTAGEETVLECRAPGARPQALPGWVGVDQLDSTQETEDVEEEDGTFSVISRLSFTPTYMENNLEISCVVDHPALDEPLEETRTLDVKHPPRVSLEWENDTVVEGDTVELRCAYFSNPSNGTLITWFYKGEVLEEVESVLEEVEGEDNLVDLLYLQVNRTSTGEYSCSAANQLGTGESLPVYLDVLYGPSVELSMDPEDALVEGDEDNVTLTCSLVDGNPEDLLDVLWFQDSFPLEVDSLECDERSCMIQLQGERSEAGNYSCVGINSAGPGPESDGQLVQVQYTSSAGLVEADKFDPVKGGNTSFSCVLEDLGFPSVESYVWKKDGAVLDWAEDSVVVLEELRAEHSGNISCSGINSAGTNFGEVYFLDVFAPPAFITELPRQVEMTEDFQWVNLTCQVECAPLCNIEWLRNMQKIIGSESLEAMTASVEDEANLFKDYEVMVSAVEEDSDYEEAAEDDLELMVGEEMITEDADSPFLISMEYVPPDFSNNQFSSVVSRLSIQLGNVSQELLDSFQFSNFTCFVASGELGEEISSTTMLAIHHEPLDMELSVEDVNLVEAEELEPVHCSASAVPEPQIVWMKDGETVSNSEVLQFENPISREDAGEYTCEASNYQGSTSRSFSLQVEYAPSCYVTKERNEDLVILKCVAEGNPQDYLFWWRHENLSFEGQVEGDTSVLSLRNVNDSMVYEYSCFVNNSIGQSEPCSVQEQEGFLYLASTEPWLLVIIILGILLAIIIVSLIIWHLCCRNKPEKGGPGSSGKSRPADNQPHPDNSFYDNLPFHGLRSPPKQVLNAVDDNMVYADVDAQETYSYGPLAYKTTSLQRAAKLKKLEESKL